MIDIVFSADQRPGEGVIAAPVFGGSRLGEAASAIDGQTGGQLRRAVEISGGKLKGGAVVDMLVPAGTKLDRVVLFGVDEEPAKEGGDVYERAGGGLAARLAGLKVARAVLDLEGLAPEAAAAVLTGAALRAYRFDKYRTTEDDDGPRGLESLVLRHPEAEAVERAFFARRAVAEAVHAARDLVTEPANVLTPAAFAGICGELAELGVEVEIFDAAKLEEQGFRTLLAVGRGSEHPPFVAVMRWNGAGDGDAPIALVGKGVCFDTGGISIKPATGMELMKNDMGGAAAVYGALRAIAARKAKANVVGVVGLAENTPSATAMRPGDVIRSLSGQTIEIINTDAEGRLLLADVLWYVKERFKPAAIVDVATLTGAVVVALGNEQAGLFASEDRLADRLRAAGDEVGELLWRLPLAPGYDKHIGSDIADMKNVGRSRQAGATAGAVFLQRFVGDVPWAHLDIAAVAWADRDRPLCPKGASGFGVRLLDRLVARHYEA